MSFDEPTRRIHAQRGGRPDHAGEAPTTAMPGPLNLAGPAEAADADSTDVLSLDEIFDPAEPAAAAPPASEPAAAGDGAPTWTAMPVVPIRSEPMTAPPTPETASTPAGRPLGGQVRDDAAAAWDGAVRRTRGWLGRDDNALMLLTALVAVILIVTVGAVGR